MIDRNIILTTALTSSLALMASTASAGEMNSSAKMDVKAQAQAQAKTVRTIDADGQVGQLTIVRDDTEQTAVLGALAVQTTDAYVVRGQDGRLYINHVIAYDDLPDPSLSVKTVDEYQTNYNGMVFTNRVVTPRT